MSATLDAHDLARQLGAERDAVEIALTRILARSVDADAVAEVVRYALLGGGKRLRPILCVAAFHAAGGHAANADDLYEAAASLELIHTYSLVHDDLPCMDDDDLRRGRATAHRVFGNTAAILAGVALIPLACRILHDSAIRLECGRERAARAVRELCSGAGATGMVGGQVLDVEAEGRTLALDELRRLHRLKTGALFAASLRIGGALAGASEVVLGVLGDFGTRLGLAFQIADDVLDVTVDASVLGKTPGKDAQAAKATFPAQLGVDGARTAARQEAAAAIGVLRDGQLKSPLLEALTGFAVHRDR